MNDVADRLARYMIVSSLMELRMMSADPSSDDNLSYRDVLYLNLISGMEECTVSKLADAACVTKPTVTVRINSLVRRGLVVRIPSETDRRVSYIMLSDRSMKVFESEWRIFEEVSDMLERRFGNERLRDFVDVMDGAFDLIEAHVPEGPQKQGA
ncbi:MarR family winged helix-turn-helix transcriptional regulator [Candidatus Methanoprimaticola sp. MG2]|uniref:MarR family winged helix-turn-helix transcriptional regulator n=1 Tax=Candidatus Methanoprimaticola sp. MG2 TaxID=3228838 RepID=UPI0039C6CD02